MAFGPSAARRTARDVENLGEDHLIPVMSLMCLLIPFLLVSAVFVTTVALQVTLPPQASASAGGAGGAGGVTKILMVGMSADKGFIITNDKGMLPIFPERSGADINWIPKVGGGFD